MIADNYEPVGVFVDLRNDEGDEREQVGWGLDVDAAVRSAEEAVRESTGDDSWVMNEWRPA